MNMELVIHYAEQGHWDLAVMLLDFLNHRYCVEAGLICQKKKN